MGEKNDKQCRLSEKSRQLMANIARQDWKVSACDLCAHRKECKK